MAAVRIATPLSPEAVKSLKTGDAVQLSGKIVTARDQVHKYLFSGGDSPVDLKGLVIYHCGPVAVEEGDAWRIVAAGPTTSMREEPYQAQIIEAFHPGAIMGKGGMGEKTRQALKNAGCIYLHLTGGAAAYIARSIERIEAVHFLEFGRPEAMWVLHVRDLPALVTMDAQGNSLHKTIESKSLEILQQVLKTPYS